MNAAAPGEPPPPTTPARGAEARGRPEDGEAATASPPQPPSRRARGGNWRSLVISMLVLLAVLAFWLGLQPRGEGVERPAVDVGVSARAFADESGWAVLVPALDGSWKASTVRHRAPAQGPRTWQVGYVRPGDDTVYVAVTQARVAADAQARQAWLADQITGGAREADVGVGGLQWERYTISGTPAREALVRPASAGEPAVVVSGLGGIDRLVEVASALRPFPAG